MSSEAKPAVRGTETLGAPMPEIAIPQEQMLGYLLNILQFADSGEGLLSNDNRVLFANNALERAGIHTGSLRDTLPPEDYSRFSEVIEAIRAERRTFPEREALPRTFSYLGKHFSLRLRGLGEAAEHLSMSDITALVSETERADFYRWLSLHDVLTGLGNDRYLTELLDETNERGINKENPLAIILADGDKFKEINDRFGHDVGDAHLKLLSIILSVSVRGSKEVVESLSENIESFTKDLYSSDPNSKLNAYKEVVEAIASGSFFDGFEFIEEEEFQETTAEHLQQEKSQNEEVKRDPSEKKDVVLRPHGDEFAILLDGITNRKDLLRLMKRLKQVITFYNAKVQEEPVGLNNLEQYATKRFDNKPLPISISFGGAYYEGDNLDTIIESFNEPGLFVTSNKWSISEGQQKLTAREVYQAADAAMYERKLLAKGFTPKEIMDLNKRIEDFLNNMNKEI